MPWTQAQFDELYSYVGEEIKKTRDKLGPFNFIHKYNPEFKLKPMHISQLGNRCISQWNSQTDAKEGMTVVVTKDGIFYEGYIKDNKIFDIGRDIYPDGTYTIYHGIDEEGKGIITETDIDGGVYEGESCQRIFHGYGIYKFPNGAIYKGNFENSEYNGDGVLQQQDGEIYEGEFKNNKYNGYGTLKWPNGEIQTGNWKDDELHGKGELIKPNGGGYYGEIYEGKKHGVGIQMVPGHFTIKGKFNDDKPEGIFTTYWSDGRKHVGEWVDEFANVCAGVHTTARGEVVPVTNYKDFFHWWTQTDNGEVTGDEEGEEEGEEE